LLSWQEFAKIQPEMASFGEERLRYKVMYLATIRPGGYPRVHPFTPFVGSGRLFAFMEATSPKGKDIQRNGRYAMHSQVADMDGTNGEFEITGDAFLVSDSASRSDAAAACPYTPAERYKLFEFKIARCMTNDYAGGKSNVRSWKISDDPSPSKR
jgi:hypothetical protein